MYWEEVLKELEVPAPNGKITNVWVTVLDNDGTEYLIPISVERTRELLFLYDSKKKDKPELEG